ncbi:MAG TPA: transposase, partial [Candidatus Sulfotelmatobacter sp.]|nr:transposase [Candidatus Sulfotelmatobacter sp.]
MHPARHLNGYGGILQADEYAGFNDLYAEGRRPAPLVDAGCWAHGRRKLFKYAELVKAPIAVEAVRRIDAIFDIERTINGLPAAQRLAVRQAHVKPLVTELENWMRAQCAKMSR